MSIQHRLDVELTRRKLADCREAAQRLIEAGRVTVDGQAAVKPARMVLDSAAVVVTGEPGEEFASRGAHKLIGTLTPLCPLASQRPRGGTAWTPAPRRRLHRRAPAAWRRRSDRRRRRVRTVDLASAAGCPRHGA